MAGGKTGGRNGAKRAVGKRQLHGRRIVGIQRVFPDLIARRLGKGCQPGRDFIDRFACDEGGKVQNMDADIAKHAF